MSRPERRRGRRRGGKRSRRGSTTRPNDAAWECGICACEALESPLVPSISAEPRAELRNRTSPSWGKFALRRAQMFGEPRRRRPGGQVELIGVCGEVAAVEELEPLGLAGAVECSESEVGRADHVVVAED